MSNFMHDIQAPRDERSNRIRPAGESTPADADRYERAIAPILFVAPWRAGNTTRSKSREPGVETIHYDGVPGGLAEHATLAP